MRRLEALGVAAALLLAPACGESSRTAGTTDVPAALTPVAGSAEWPVATLGEARVDPAPLLDLIARIRRREYGTVDSLLVARHGRLVVEEYFGGWSEGRAHTVQSVTKSVTSLLVGLAIAEGRVGLDDRVLDLFPGYQPVANDDDRKRRLTLADLLTMRSGLNWSEDPYAGSPLERLNGCGCDWLRFVLDWPMREQPGTRWEYVSGGPILLGGVVGAVTGERVDRFADSRLFGPLGVRGATWARGLPDGLPHMGGGLDLRPRDMAKLGALIVDGGRWQGNQVVPESWIRESTARLVPPAVSRQPRRRLRLSLVAPRPGRPDEPAAAPRRHHRGRGRARAVDLRRAAPGAGGGRDGELRRQRVGPPGRLPVHAHHPRGAALRERRHRPASEARSR
jgi:CubicO group peptidase (beta-lactamase class C family)